MFIKSFVPVRLFPSSRTGGWLQNLERKLTPSQSQSSRYPSDYMDPDTPILSAADCVETFGHTQCPLPNLRHDTRED